MTKRYNVHLYREMRLKFEGIEAETPEGAAAIARDGLTSDADEIDDCDGLDLSALVDEVGDDEYERSVTIDFEEERLRKAAPELLESHKQICALAHFAWDLAEDADPQIREAIQLIIDAANAASAQATSHRPISKVNPEPSTN